MFSNKLCDMHTDETHLFAIPDDSYMYETDNNDIVIPCRPTSPDTNVLLFVNHDGYDSNTNVSLRGFQITIRVDFFIIYQF